jgi:transcriptional antiterminator
VGGMEKKLKMYLTQGEMYRIKELDLELMHYMMSMMLDCTYIMKAVSQRNDTKVIEKIVMLNNRLEKISGIVKKMNEIITTNEEER